MSDLTTTGNIGAPDVAMYRTARIAGKIMDRLIETGTPAAEAVELVFEYQCVVLEESAEVLLHPKAVGMPSDVLRAMARVLRSHTDAALAAAREATP